MTQRSASARLKLPDIRYADCAAVVVAGAMVALWAIDPEPEPFYTSTPHVWLSLAVGVAGAVALWWRRAHAVLLACWLIVGSVFLSTLSGPSLVALFAVASYRCRRLPVTLWVAALAAASTPAQLLIGTPLHGKDVWRGTLLLILVGLVAVGWGTALRVRRELIQSLREQASQLVRERDLIAERARSDEREEIARDMHDSLAHRLSLISMSAGALRYRQNEIPHDLADLATILGENSKAALVKLRSAVKGIRSRRDGKPTRVSFPYDIHTLIEDSRVVGQEIDAHVDMPRAAAQSTTRTIYQTVQELLTNARKHSPNVPVRLEISGTPEAGVRIVSFNDIGTTNDLPTNGGFGIVGMRERVRLKGGRLSAGRTAGGRFEVNVWLPWGICHERAGEPDHRCCRR